MHEFQGYFLTFEAKEFTPKKWNSVWQRFSVRVCTDECRVPHDSFLFCFLWWEEAKVFVFLDWSPMSCLRYEVLNFCLKWKKKPEKTNAFSARQPKITHRPLSKRKKSLCQLFLTRTHDACISFWKIFEFPDAFQYKTFNKFINHCFKWIVIRLRFL